MNKINLTERRKKEIDNVVNRLFSMYGTRDNFHWDSLCFDRNIRYYETNSWDPVTMHLTTPLGRKGCYIYCRESRNTSADAFVKAHEFGHAILGEGSSEDEADYFAEKFSGVKHNFLELGKDFVSEGLSYFLSMDVDRNLLFALEDVAGKQLPIHPKGMDERETNMEAVRNTRLMEAVSEAQLQAVTEIVFS